MAWVTPSSVSTGDVLTASEWNQSVVANSLMGIPAFTNEAARDAAISSPSEGQMCYLTAPTVPAITGDVGAVPTGVQTIYNGSVWVCVTPISAGQTTAQSTTTSANYTDLATAGPVVTLVTGTQALVTFGALSYPTVGSGAGFMAVAVSGATTAAAPAGSTMNNIEFTSTERSKDRTFIVTLANAGINTFTLKYKTTAGTTTNFEGRFLSVRGIA